MSDNVDVGASDVPSYSADVAAFMRMAGQEVVTGGPRLPDGPTIELRERLIAEEVGETLAALQSNDLVGIADGIADSIVVLIGAALAYGIPMDAVWGEVHRSNMSKAGGSKDAFGKLLKPAGWQPPDVAGVLRRAGWGDDTGEGDGR